MDTDYRISALAGFGFDELFACHVQAFKGYPFQWDRNALKKTIDRRGYNPALSFGAFYNGQLVSFTWNGIGTYNGLKTAYDTGTGTIEEHRGKGLASKIFEHSIPYLKAAGIEQYILEVLEENNKAYSVYERQGFVVSRTFDCFRTNLADWILPERALSDEIILKEIDLSYQLQMEAMTDFTISWQNNFQALLKNPDDFVVTGAFRDNELVGYGIVEPASGDISQLAVVKNERRNGIGSNLLAALKKMIKAGIVKVVNIESKEKGIIEFVTKNGIPKIVSQYEMIKRI